MRVRRVVWLLAVLGVAGCGSASDVGAPADVTAPADSPTLSSAGSPPGATHGVLTKAAVESVVAQTYPDTPSGHTEGCVVPACPFSQRLTAEVTALSAEGPTPVETGMSCALALVAGSDKGLDTPVQSEITLASDHATAAIADRGPGRRPAIVTLTIIAGNGGPIVDDIAYTALLGGRSIYHVDCAPSSPSADSSAPDDSG